jgi:ADP-heptose:LPS heptosyltransferase
MIDYYDIKRDLENIEKLLKLVQKKQFEDVTILAEDLINKWANFIFSDEYDEYTDLEHSYKILIHDILENFIDSSAIDEYLESICNAL